MNLDGGWLEHDTLFDMHHADRRMVGDWITWGVHTRRWRPDTCSCYRGHARRWLDHLREGGVQARRASAADIRRYLDDHYRNPASRDQVRTAIVALYDWMRELGKVKANPAREVARIPDSGSLPRSLEAADVVRVFEAARRIGGDRNLLAHLYAYAAVRRDEARTLQWGAFEDAANWLRFTEKGGQERVVPLHPEARRAVMLWQASCPSPRWVFPSPRKPHQPVCRATINAWFGAIGDEAGVYVTPHMLRHSAATELLRAGRSLAEVMDLLGHRSLSSTTRYVRSRPQHVADAVSSLPWSSRG